VLDGLDEASKTVFTWSVASLSENYLTLSRMERLEAIGLAATESGRPIHVLEKDIWVVWALDGLSRSQFGEHLVLKGGASLSKGYNIIRRLSNDVDVIYDIRQVVPDLAGDDPIPRTNRQAEKWTRKIDQKLAVSVQSKALSIIKKHIEETTVHATATAVDDKIYIDYDSLTKGAGHVYPRVIIEFRAHSTGEPSEKRTITCDAAIRVPNLRFPSATLNAMLPKRTFWEKALVMHVYCTFWEKATAMDVFRARGRQGDRHSLHWHDLMRLDEAGYAKAALEDRGLANSVAAFKARFFRANDSVGNPIDFDKAVSGNLKLVPYGGALEALEAGYKMMSDDGILLDDAEPFSIVIERCVGIEKRANSR
jgi:hypothetical protein